MVDSTKTVLLIDFDSVRRGLSDVDPKAAPLFAERAAAWVEALEHGDLATPPELRQILIKRCYGDPRILGEGSAHFRAAGFDVIECPPHASGRSSTQLHLVIDAIDALNSDTDYDEFILLSAEVDLGPLIRRLKRDGQRTLIYADDKTRPAYRQMADGVLPAKAIANFVSGNGEAPPKPVSRAEIEAFASKISEATGIPLFSPKTYAELFRHLAEEIATSGYNFQTTARSVSDKLVEAGRSVTRRQVVFVVKGLALKGHVFSDTDSPRHLAEVFCEQSRYLISNAGLTVEGSEERLLSGWLVDRAIGKGAADGRPHPAPATASVQDQPAANVPPAPTEPQPERLARKKKSADTGSGKSSKSKKLSKSRAKKNANTKARGADPQTISSQTPADGVKDAGSATADAGDPAPAKAGPRKIRSADEVKAQIAARIAASVDRRRPGAEPEENAGERSKAGRAAAHEPEIGAAEAAAARRSKRTARRRAAEETSTPPPSPPKEPRLPAEQGEELESSILAAIAQAVDVLVEGGEGEATDQAEQSAAKSKVADSGAAGSGVAGSGIAGLEVSDSDAGDPVPEPAAPAQTPDPIPSDGEEGDDIGDEIQRIIASYSRDRNKPS
jgi:hypothetical protein